MTTRKIILYSLIVPLFTILFLIIPAIIKKSMGEDWILTLLCSLFVPSVIGYFLSANLSLLTKSERSKKILILAGQLVIVVPLLILVFSKFTDHQHSDSADNLENNMEFMTKIDPTKERPYEMSAFIRLESAFDDPGAFVLNTCLEERKDTLVGKDSLQIHLVYFKYVVSDKKNYYSKMRVFNDSASFEIFNGDVKNMPPNLGKISETEAKILDSLIEQHPEFQREDIRNVLKSLKK
jgi:hypothetical protein